MGPSSYFKDLNEKNLFEKYYTENPVQKQIDSKINDSYNIFSQDKGPQIKDDNIFEQNKGTQLSKESDNPFNIDISGFSKRKEDSEDYSIGGKNKSKKDKPFAGGLFGEKAEGDGATQQIAGDALNLGKGIFSQATTESKTGAEGFSRGLETTMSAAKLGMSIGGPIGAGVGAVGGAIYSTIDYFNDKENQTNRRSDEMIEENAKKKEIIDRDYLLDKGQKQIKKLSALRSSQLNYINLNNY